MFVFEFPLVFTVSVRAEGTRVAARVPRYPAISAVICKTRAEALDLLISAVIRKALQNRQDRGTSKPACQGYREGHVILPVQVNGGFVDDQVCG